MQAKIHLSKGRMFYWVLNPGNNPPGGARHSVCRGNSICSLCRSRREAIVFISAWQPRNHVDPGHVWLRSEFSLDSCRSRSRQALALTKSRVLHVCFWPKADVTWARRGVRFQGESGHDANWQSRPSLTLFRHEPSRPVAAQNMHLGASEALNRIADLHLLVLRYKRQLSL